MTRIASYALALTLCAAGAAPPSITPDGWGAVRIGMPSAGLIGPLKLRQGPDGEDECVDYASDLHKQLLVMSIHGRVARVSVWEPGPIATDRGVRIGDPQVKVRRLYPKARAEPHAYADPPARYLTDWDSKRRRGLRFEIGGDGRVAAIHAGGPAIRFVEGCL